MEGAWQVPGSSWAGGLPAPLQAAYWRCGCEYAKGLQAFLLLGPEAREASAFWGSREGNKGLTGNRGASATKKVLVAALAPAPEGLVAGVAVMST